MKSKVVLIVILIVVGAILLSTRKKDIATIESQSSSRKWVSADEISLTAKAIIGELDEEAMEALPSDLTPNTDDLVLTDEEKTELFAILNSVTETGKLGSASPLGASVMKNFLKKKAIVKRMINQLKQTARKLEKRIPTIKNKDAKRMMSKKLITIREKLKRKENELTAIIQKINQLKAKKKANASEKEKTPEDPSTRLKVLMRQAEALKKKYSEIQKAISHLKKNSKVVSDRAKDKKITSAQASKYKQKAEKRLKRMIKSMDSVRKSINMVNSQYQAEKRRIATEKRQNAQKALEKKKSLDNQMAAKKRLEQSKAQAAVKEAEIKIAKARDATKLLDAKREGEKAQKMAEAHQEHNVKVANAERARLEFEETQTKKKYDALAKRKSVVKREQEVVAEKTRREKEAIESMRRKNEQRHNAQLARMKASEEKQKKKEKEALQEAEKIKNVKLRKKAQEMIRKRAAAERKQRAEFAEKMASLYHRREEMLRGKEEALELKHRKEDKGVLQRQQEAERKEQMLKKRLREVSAKAAQMAADQKQRDADQKRRSQRAHALKKKQLALEKESEMNRVNAEAALEKAKKDVSAKKALAKQRRLEKIKAEAEFRKQKAEQAEKAKKERMIELEKGVQKITGMTINSLDLSSLDKTVLLELKVLVEATGGHRILPAIIKMIELKSKKEEAQAQIDAETEEAAEVVEKDKAATPMTEKEKREKIKNDFFENVDRITGGAEMNGPGSLIALDFSVLEELLAYSKTLTTGRLAKFSDVVKNEIFTKKLISVFEQAGGTRYVPWMRPDQVAWNEMTIVDVDKVIEFLNLEPPIPEVTRRWLQVANKVRDSKMAKIIEEKEAAEEERARKQAEELKAIEQARVVQAEKDAKKATAKLDQDAKDLTTKIVAVDEAVSVEKHRVDAETQKEVENILLEHEDEKQAAVKEIEQGMKEKEKELVAESRRKIEDIDAEADSKLVDLQQQKVEEENQIHSESLVAVTSIEAEISKTENKAAIQALEDKLRQEEASRTAALDQTRKVHALRQQAVEEETRLQKDEILNSTESKLEEEKALATENLKSAVETIEQQTQELLKKQEEVHAAETEKIDVEGSIRTDILEQKKREVEKDKEIVEDDLSKTTEGGEKDKEEEQEEQGREEDDDFEAAHPRASKENRVKVSRKNNKNGSSFIKLRVPSDMSPGEEDEITIFLSKDAVDLLAQYHVIHKNIQKEGSIDDVSADAKKILASAGAEFKTIRDQYVKQRAEKVLERQAKLIARV